MKRQKGKPSQNSPPNEAPFPYGDYVQAQRDLQNIFAGPCTYSTICAASGMGKTSLARGLNQQNEGTRNTILYLSSSRVSAMGVVRCVAQRLHIWPKRNYLETVQIVADALSNNSGHMMLWIDEADQVDVATLQEVRMVAESELRETPLMSVVLSGLPSLASLLDTSVLFPLKRRIELQCILAGLRRNELDPFIVHRFGSVGEQRIPTAIRDELFERTQAAPAVIDKVVRRALGHNGEGFIDVEVFRAVLDTAGL
jgi:type II secretory pathway predicted ATPase ExeA